MSVVLTGLKPVSAVLVGLLGLSLCVLCLQGYWA